MKKVAVVGWPISSTIGISFSKNLAGGSFGIDSPCKSVPRRRSGLLCLIVATKLHANEFQETKGDVNTPACGAIPPARYYNKSQVFAAR